MVTKFMQLMNLRKYIYVTKSETCFAHILELAVAPLFGKIA